MARDRARYRFKPISTSIRADLFADPGCGSVRSSSSRALFFYDRDLWETLSSSSRSCENPGSMQPQYAEALGIGADARARSASTVTVESAGRPAVAGLAPWQQKRVAAYIEERVADNIPLAPSPSWRGSVPTISPVGSSVRRHAAAQISRQCRIERAKQLLANRELSITTNCARWSASARRARSPPRFTG